MGSGLRYQYQRSELCTCRVYCPLRMKKLQGELEVEKVDTQERSEKTKEDLDAREVCFLL